MSVESEKGPAHGVTLTGTDTPTGTGQKVTIFDEPEHIPYETGQSSPPNSSPKLRKASISGKKMTGRPPLLSEHPSFQGQMSPSISRTISRLNLNEGDTSESPTPGEPASGQDETRKLLGQVMEWLTEEKTKRQSKRSSTLEPVPQGIEHHSSTPIGGESDLALEKLDKILTNFAAGLPSTPTGEVRPRKSHSLSNLRRGSIGKVFKRTHAHPNSSDTEWTGDDINVPHVEASLDNSKTLAFTGGNAEIDDIEAAQQKDMKHWIQFKQEIVRLTHTLKIRGWRRIPIDKGEVISVERLSGALTNAVYVVKPPKDLPEPDNENSTRPYTSKSKPAELLLRIYGPQVEHLIDREAELGVLRRLARKKIGPRLLGYFTNGRFEEYLHAKTLTAEDIRIPATSKQIAKRMRELHEGIELLPSEIKGGSSTLDHLSKWVDRCEIVMTWLDMQVKLANEGHTPASERYTRRGLICGIEWPVFRKTLEKYRKFLMDECGGKKAVQKKLIFAHNDAQYGNLMRLDPPGESPLLQPANEHRQLIVIDFEYAGANSRGYEFANHFTEWCYNYHIAETSWACNTKVYPTPKEQYTFVRAYLMHRPQFAAGASSTPKMDGRDKTSIPDFILDARTPTSAQGSDYDEQEKKREEKLERDIQHLIRETRLWRIANAAFWTCWGIVQAKVPELDDPPKKSKTARMAAALEKVRERIYAQSDPIDDDVKALQESSKHDRPEGQEKEEAHAEGNPEDGDRAAEEGDDEEEIEEFDYLAYAQDRAMLFWGDCLQMGIVKEEELTESLLKQVKIVSY